MGTGVDKGGGKSHRREEVKSRLRTALQNLAVDRSFRDVTVIAIASAAGLSRSAFYFYYEDKRDLLIEAVNGISEATFDLTSAHFNGNDDPREMVHEVLRDNAAAWERHGDLLRLVIEASIYDEVVRTFWGDVLGDFIAAVTQRLLADQGEGLIPKELDVATCADILVTATVGFFHNRISLGDTSTEDAVAALEPIWVRVLYP